jgi:hypothetical protein
MCNPNSTIDPFFEELERSDYRKLRRLEKQLQAKLYIEHRRPAVLARIAEFEALLASHALEEAKNS